MSLHSIETIILNNRYSSKLIFEDKGASVLMRYELNDITIKVENTYPFFALNEIRLQLELRNMFLLCNGSRIDVYPSGMSAIGLMAYEMVMRKQATKLVNILDPAENPSLITTVQNQKQFRDDWLKSLGT